MKAQDPIIGIDLGTTFSLVAYAGPRGPQVIRDADGDARVPSVLSFAPDGSVSIGWEARRHAVENPQHTVYSVKRLMGLGLDDLKEELPHLSYRVVRGQRDVVKIDLDGELLTPQEVSALILRELKQRAEAHLGREVKRAVVTVPAYFDDPQRQATRDAGRIAGLEVVRVLHEPTAAALAYGIGARADEAKPRAKSALPIGDKSQCEATDATAAKSPRPGADDSLIAVFDFGGGTFDVSILRLHEGVFEVVATKGDTHLGGDDLDRCIINLVRNEAAHRFGTNIEAPATRQALRLLAESVKIELSKNPSTRIELDFGGGRRFERSLSRDDFETMISPLVERTLDCCRQALRDAKVSPGAIGQVVLVGGSTRIPLVRRRVEAFFRSVPYTALNPDEVVALGAAVQAQILAGGRDDAILLDVTPLSLGIETMGGAMGKLIMRNTRIPCQAIEAFTTFVDGQANVKINVLQGERELAADCRSLAEFDLQGIPSMPAGIPKIEVQFLIDANGILNVSARELRSGKEASIQVLPSHGLTREEVARIEQESVRFAREDLSAHRLIDLRNQIEFDTHKTEETLAQYGHLLEAEQRRALEEGIRVLRDLAQKTDDAEKLHRALDAFGKSTEALANLAITESLRQSSRSDADRSSAPASTRS